MINRNQILDRIAKIAANTGIEDLDNPNAKWTVSENTGKNSWVQHEGITLTDDERRQVLEMVANGTFTK